MIYATFKSPVTTSSFSEALAQLGIDNSFHGRRLRTPAEDRVVGTLLTACRLGRKTVVQNFNSDVCVIFDGLRSQLSRVGAMEWELVPYAFTDPFADLKERIRRMPK